MLLAEVILCRHHALYHCTHAAPCQNHECFHQVPLCPAGSRVVQARHHGNRPDMDACELGGRDKTSLREKLSPKSWLPTGPEACMLGIAGAAVVQRCGGRETSH